jgi:hypothetical protein
VHPEILRRLPESLPRFYFLAPNRSPDLASLFLVCGSFAGAFAASAPPEKQSNLHNFGARASPLE